MKSWILASKWTAYSTAIGSVTMTPLMGLVVGDKRPSAAATALQLLVAVLLMLVTLALTLIDSRRSRLGLSASQDVDQFAAARQQAHDAGLPWVEGDGNVSWPAKPPAQARRATGSNPTGGGS